MLAGFLIAVPMLLTAYAAQTDRLPHKIVLVAVVMMTIAGVMVLYDELTAGDRRADYGGRRRAACLLVRLAGVALSLRRIPRSSQPSRSVTSWRNREFSSSSSAILSPALSVRWAISLCSFPRIAKSFAGANFVATSILE
jgi:hypothetical protein